ncbi:MAG TPA: hypothetical protein VFJ85_06715 [Acidimicrobiales bacterium]|nr:hypothetical protein [Acidimicrobiales bacterium]
MAGHFFGDTSSELRPGRFVTAVEVANMIEVVIGAPGRPRWVFQFLAPGRSAPKAGTYDRLPGLAARDPAGGFSINIQDSDCAAERSTVTIDKIRVDLAGGLTRLKMRFVHRCNGAAEPPDTGAIDFTAA